MKCEPRVLWSTGQTLLPEHLRRLEDSILSQFAVRNSFTGLPGYGFARLRFGRALEADGLLTIESGYVCMRSGTLLSVGENASVNTINLNAPGKPRQKVFIHLLSPELPTSRADALQSAEIPVWQWRLILSYDEEIEGTLEYLPLGVVESDINGFWKLSDDFIPPLLQVGSPGFLRKDLDILAISLEKYEKALLETMADLQLSGENLIRARRMLIEVRFFSHYLTNLKGEVPQHPYEVVMHLDRLHLEIAAYQDQESVQLSHPYQHMNLTDSLLHPIRSVVALLERSRESGPMAEFVLSDGLYKVAMTESCTSAMNWFILIQKPSSDFDVPLAGVKFASENRLPIVHKYFLQGVALKQVDRPVFQHYFGPDVEIWEIQKNDEWTEALNERSISFLSSQAFNELKFFLYWSYV